MPPGRSRRLGVVDPTSVSAARSQMSTFSKAAPFIDAPFLFRHVRALYDSNVSYQDELLGQLIAKLEAPESSKTLAGLNQNSEVTAMKAAGEISATKAKRVMRCMR